jgi:hypothetical protein
MIKGVCDHRFPDLAINGVKKIALTPTNIAAHAAQKMELS